MINKEAYDNIAGELRDKGTTLVAVSKIKPASDIRALYDLGQKDFGENYVQEMTEKAALLPEDINWHFIGHLQSNKVKYIAPFVYMIHGVDSFKLLLEINKQGARHGRIIRCLLQVHIAEEETKYGLDEKEITDLLEFYTAQKNQLNNILLCGVMGMASFSDDRQQVREEFRKLKTIFDVCRKAYFLGDQNFNTLSMGMSGDYRLAIEEGSNMVRIGSLLFGKRA